MHLLSQSILGILMLLSIVLLVIVKQLTTGSLLEKPTGVFRVRFTNIFNLFFLLIVLPVSAILLIAGKTEVFDPSHLTVNNPSLLLGLEIAGMVLYVLGYFLMAWALISLRDNYQLGEALPGPATRWSGPDRTNWSGIPCIRRVYVFFWDWHFWFNHPPFSFCFGYILF